MINEAFSINYKDFLNSHENNPKAIISKFADLINSKDPKDPHGISRGAKSFLLELTRQTIHREINQENYLMIIETIFKDFPVFVNSTLAETIWLLGFILEKRNESLGEDQQITPMFSNLVNSLIKRKVILTNTLIEKMEESSLFDFGLISDKKTFKTKITRINTKITYEQQKYNLLREESEGFTKLLFLLFMVKITKENVKNYIDRILCLIGFFDLDPNRVLDIILSSFEKDSLNANFLELVKLFNRNAVTHMIGFKLTHKKDDDEGLYVVTAQLIKHRMIQLSEIIPYLTPTLREIETQFKSQLEAAGEYYKNLQSRVSRELNLASLSSTTTVTTTDNPSQNANYFVNFPELVSEAYKTDSTAVQIYRLFEGLVKVKSSEHCELLFSLIENFYDPLVCPTLVKTICDTVTWMIEPIYRQFSMRKLFEKRIDGNQTHKKMMIHNVLPGDKDEMLVSLSEENPISEFKQINRPDVFLAEIASILKFLTLGLSQDQTLFAKILIIIKENLKIYFNEENNNREEYQKIITDLTCKVFFPSLSLVDPAPAMINDIWSILSNFDYSKRYKIYNYWINNIYTTHPVLYIKHGVVTKETAKWHKTLSKENQRSHGRTLGILTNSNPIIVFDNVVRLLTSYDNQINVFMGTLSFCSSLSYDVITYVIGKILADPYKEKFNLINGDMATWFKYFAYFIGHFFKKFHFAEFRGVLHYLAGRLKNTNNFIEMYVLKEIVEKMSGVSLMEEMNEGQVLALAGGVHLYFESMDLVKDHKNLKKPTQALLEFFIENSETENECLNEELKVNTENVSMVNASIIDLVAHTNKSIIPDKDENEVVNIIGITTKIDTGEVMVNPAPTNRSVLISTRDDDSSSLKFTHVLLILLGTRRQNVIFNSNFSQSKLIGFLYDQIQNTFLQLVQFLSLNTDKVTYAKFLPKWRLERFVINYNCQPEVIFFLNRNKLKPLYEMTNEEYTDNMNQFMGTLDTYQTFNKKVFHEGFDSMYIDSLAFLEDIYKPIWNYVTPELYFIFSSLQLSDIYVPGAHYEREIEKNKKEMERIQEEGKIYSESQSKNKKEVEKIRVTIQNLEKELSLLKRNNEKIKQFLEDKKSLLLDDKLIAKSNRREISRNLIQYCLYPRLIFSKIEAVYAAKMLVLLINLKIQNVNVFDIMQKIVKFLLPCILCLTELEAQNLGIFLLEILKVIKYWQDEVVWENECFKNPSFSRNLDTASPVDLADFKKVIVCLLSKMNSTFLNIFNGNDYMSCRNAIIVLNYINTVYPPTKEITNDLTTSLEKAIEKFVNYEDLTMMLKRYRDILFSKKSNLPFEHEIIGEGQKDKMQVEKEKLILNEEKVEKEKDSKNGILEKKKKKDRSREKKREETSRTPDIKKRSPEDYRTYKSRK